MITISNRVSDEALFFYKVLELIIEANNYGTGTI